MPVAITIRNVPDHVRDELAARATRSGRSLQEYLSAELLHLASTPSPEDALAQVRASARASGGSFDVDTILADRDAGRS